MFSLSVKFDIRYTDNCSSVWAVLISFTLTGSYKLVFGTGTKLMVETSEYLCALNSCCVKHLELTWHSAAPVFHVNKLFDHSVNNYLWESKYQLNVSDIRGNTHTCPDTWNCELVVVVERRRTVWLELETEK